MILVMRKFDIWFVDFVFLFGLIIIVVLIWICVNVGVFINDFMVDDLDDWDFDLFVL